MKFDIHTALCDFDGEPIIESQQVGPDKVVEVRDKAGKPKRLTAWTVIRNALVSDINRALLTGDVKPDSKPEAGIDNMEKFKRGELACRVLDTGELTDEEREFLRKMAGEMYRSPLVYFAFAQFLAGKPQRSAEGGASDKVVPIGAGG